MLKVFYGTDVVAVRQAAFTCANEYEERGATLATIDSDTFVPGTLKDAVGAVSLFGDETIYVIDTPSDNKDLEGEVTEQLEVMGESGNVFLLIEGSLLAPSKKTYAKHASSMEEYKGDKAERFNTFAFADALAKKDKKSLWIHLQNARAGGIATEEIIGVLWWQLKALLLAQKTSSAAAAGMKDFPYNKAKRALSTFKDGELDTLSLSLLTLYHDGHGGIVDIDEALEKWLLTL